MKITAGLAERSDSYGLTENDGHEIDGHENYGHEIGGQMTIYIYRLKIDYITMQCAILFKIQDLGNDERHSDRCYRSE